MKVKSHDGGALQHGQVSNDGLACVGLTKRQRWTAAKKTNENKRNKENPSATRQNTCRCYNWHLEQPHSRAVSISSEYEVPSVHRNTTFLLRVLVTPQQTPEGAVAWQDRGQSMRGILLVDVHVLSGWWRFSCSLTISPWHVSSGRRWGRGTHTQNIYCMWWQSFLFSGRLHLWDKTTVLSVNQSQFFQHEIKKVIDQQFYCYFWA